MEIEEIERRVVQADAARSAKRIAAAKRIGELVQLRAEAAEKLADLDGELGVVLAESSDVIRVDELADFTDVSAADLDQWLTGHKSTRPKRKRTATKPAAKGETSRVSPTAKTSPAGQIRLPPDVAVTHTAPDQSTRTPVPAT